ncbi:MAG: MiaB/RimO family radical SAM methylthiotransferase [Gemmatimonadetes bacterium]|nr:MiaB/RimO family radical SAM methylthiotransferase [Gemmatimonadota bacterium]
MTKKAYVETYGCQMNISDGELMQGILAACGYEIVGAPHDADVILVNTCAIRERAEQRVLGRVAQLNGLKAQRPDLVIGVTGCMAQRMGTRLLERAPYVDIVMGPDGYRELPHRLAELEAARVGGFSCATADIGTRSSAAAALSPHGWGHPAAAPAPASGPATPSAPQLVPLGLRRGRRTFHLAVQLAVLDLQAHENYEGLEARRSSGVSAWVPIQRGCNRRCTFCIVPYVRGPEKNRHPDHILAEIREIAASGVPEITLLGQTVNSYRCGDWNFARLLQAVARTPGLRRVRFTSPHPNDVTPELVQVMAEEPAVCEHLHLPVQAGHNRTLKRMLRRYTVDSFLEKVAMVREAIPGIALSTDVIVAFPGESEGEFEATLDLLRRVRFDEAFTYRYSPRDGTPATRLPPRDFIEPEVAQERLERLIGVQRAIQTEISRTEVGRVAEVLVERAARVNGQALGRTRRNKVVAFPGDATLTGRFLTVRLTATTGSTFVGHAVDSPALAQSA